VDDVARVLAECAANPDDDAPRLVWADLVGGERGELVVLQCDLARGGLTPQETARRRRRERELLELHAVEWAGTLTRVASRWSFRRGFIEAARVRAWTPLVEWPLLRSVTLEHWTPGKLAGLEQLRALGLVYMPGHAMPALEHLHALAVEGIEVRHMPNAIEMIANAPIETLCLRSHRVGTRSIEALLTAADRLVALELAMDNPREDNGIEVAGQRQLRALRLGRVRVRELSDLEGSRTQATLEHFGFELHGQPTALADILAAFPRLRMIELGGDVQAAARAVLDARPPALRVVWIRGEVSPDVSRLLAEHYDVETRAPGDELLHESPEAFGVLGPPWFEASRPAIFARLDRPEIFEIPSMPADERLFIGRGADNPIRLSSGTVARTHAILHWRNGAHEIEDTRSTNGILRGTERVTRTALHDGDELILGAVILRYFVGEGAHDRAQAAISERSTR